MEQGEQGPRGESADAGGGKGAERVTDRAFNRKLDRWFGGEVPQGDGLHGRVVGGNGLPRVLRQQHLNGAGEVVHHPLQRKVRHCARHGGSELGAEEGVARAGGADLALRAPHEVGEFRLRRLHGALLRREQPRLVRARPPVRPPRSSGGVAIPGIRTTRRAASIAR